MSFPVRHRSAGGSNRDVLTKYRQVWEEIKDEVFDFVADSDEYLETEVVTDDMVAMAVGRVMMYRLNAVC